MSQQSSDVRVLLLSICLQICSVYNVDPPGEEQWESGNRMARQLQSLLELGMDDLLRLNRSWNDKGCKAITTVICTSTGRR